MKGTIIFGLVASLVFSIVMTGLGLVSRLFDVPLLKELVLLPGEMLVIFLGMFVWYLTDRPIEEPVIISIAWLPIALNFIVYFVSAAFFLLALKVSRMPPLPKQR